MSDILLIIAQVLLEELKPPKPATGVLKNIRCWTIIYSYSILGHEIEVRIYLRSEDVLVHRYNRVSSSVYINYEDPDLIQQIQDFLDRSI